MRYKILTLLTLLFAYFLANFHINSFSFNTPDINKSFPHKINNFVGTDYQASKGVYEMIPANKMLLRIYDNKKIGYKASLAIVLTDKREHIHDPDICYQEQGFVFGSREIAKISKNRNITYIPAFKEKQKVDIYYWYTDLIDTFPFRKEFMEHVVISRFFDKPFGGYGLVILIAPNKFHKETLDFIKSIDSELTKMQE